YAYDRTTRKATFLFSDMPKLEGLPLAKMTPVILTARDGLSLVSYLTLPVGSDANGDGKPDHPLPMVLFVHGGPWARDEYGYSGYHQWLANRGSRVVSVNYRGSTGFGKSYISAGDHQWGARMHDDLIDAVDWSIRQGGAAPDK